MKKREPVKVYCLRGGTHEKIKTGETPSNLNNNIGDEVCFSCFFQSVELEERRGGELAPVKLHHRGQLVGEAPRMQPHHRDGPLSPETTSGSRCNTANLAIVYSLLRNVNLFALRCAALPLVFVVFSPLLSPFSLVDCSEIKATPLEESEYFRCGERGCVSHHLCSAERQVPPLAQTRLAGPLGPGDINQGHLSERGNAPLPSFSPSHFHFTAFEPKINESK